jgi:hypothetical protein
MMRDALRQFEEQRKLAANDSSIRSGSMIDSDGLFDDIEQEQEFINNLQGNQNKKANSFEESLQADPILKTNKSML